MAEKDFTQTQEITQVILLSVVSIASGEAVNYMTMCIQHWKILDLFSYFFTCQMSTGVAVITGYHS